MLLLLHVVLRLFRNESIEIGSESVKVAVFISASVLSVHLAILTDMWLYFIDYFCKPLFLKSLKAVEWVLTDLEAFNIFGPFSSLSTS